MRTNRHPDWALTTLFYAALHYMDACPLPQDPRSHQRRNECILARRDLNPAYPSYRLLEDKSRDTRYECFVPTPDQIQWLRTEHFDPLQARLAALLRSQSKA